jgi:hemoglobin/transferrin/lactoferrin receptor protein
VSGTHFPGNTFVSNGDLKPEKSEGYEVGTRLRFRDVLQARDQVRFSFAWFDTDYEDFIETVVTATTTTPTNITNANIYGGEAELAYDGQVLFGGLTLSYVRGRDEGTGQWLESIPADKAVLTFGARLASWDLRMGWTSEFVDEQDRVRFSTVTGSTPAERTGGYGVHGIFVSWQPDDGMLKGVRVNAGIDNLTDKNYRRHQATISEEGRDYHASVSYLKAF